MTDAFERVLAEDLTRRAHPRVRAFRMLAAFVFVKEQGYCPAEFDDALHTEMKASLFPTETEECVSRYERFAKAATWDEHSIYVTFLMHIEELFLENDASSFMLSPASTPATRLF